MTWKKALALLVAVSMLASPVPAYAHGLAAQAAPAAVDEFADYAAREAQAADLESWTGGFHELVLGVLVLFLVVWLIVEVCTPVAVHIDHGHRHHHGPVHP
jgi:hypothetical protein